MGIKAWGLITVQGSWVEGLGSRGLGFNLLKDVCRAWSGLEVFAL